MDNFNININADKIVGQLDRINQAVERTGGIINTVNKASGGSFDRLAGFVSDAGGMFTRVSGSIEKVTDRLQICTQSIRINTGAISGSIEAFTQHITTLGKDALATFDLTALTQELTAKNLLNTVGIDENVIALGTQALDFGKNLLAAECFSGAVEALTQSGLLNTLGIDENIISLGEQGLDLGRNLLASENLTDAIKALTDSEFLNTLGIGDSIREIQEQATALWDNAKETFDLRNIRDRLTDAEGNFSAQAAISTAMTLWSSITKMKDAAAAIKNSFAKKKEMVATKAGTKVDAIGAKAKLALTAAKPFVGPIMVAAGVAALAGALIAMRSRLGNVPGMATGGVVSAPTLTLVGEGRYPEAVVPLGNSPQFSSMKEDIANAVLQGMGVAMSKRGSTSSRPGEIVLNIDGTRLARVMLPNLAGEQKRMGYNVTVREV